MGTKIQINSLAALERLIGGDTQLELEIRSSVVLEFAKIYLKPLFTSELKNYCETLLAEIKTEVRKQLGLEYKGYPARLELNQEAKEAVKEFALKSVRVFVDEKAAEIKEHLEDYMKRYETHLKRQLDASFDKIKEEAIQQEIQQRWQKLIKTAQNEVEDNNRSSNLPASK